MDLFYDERKAHLSRPGLDLHPYVTRYQCQHGGRREWELIYVLVGQRAARALGDLMMHANRFTLEEAARFAVANTPRGWLRENAATVWGEQHLYLQQPAYGTSYLIGKIQGERILMDRHRELGDRFSMKQFMDAFNAVGLIPISLVRWELTGDGSEILHH